MTPIHISLAPMGAARARSSSRTARHYTPQEYRLWLARAAALAREDLARLAEDGGDVGGWTPAGGTVCGDAGVQVRIRAVYERPIAAPVGYTSRQWGSAAYRACEVPRFSKPDVDNIAKAVLDALTGIAWQDDARVWRLSVERVYARAGDAARVEVEVSPWGGAA